MTNIRWGKKRDNSPPNREVYLNLCILPVIVLLTVNVSVFTEARELWLQVSVTRAAFQTALVPPSVCREQVEAIWDPRAAARAHRRFVTALEHHS